MGIRQTFTIVKKMEMNYRDYSLYMLIVRLFVSANTWQEAHITNIR